MQLSFQVWTNQMQETLNSKKLGDSAFRAKDFTAAIDCYRQVSFVPVLFLLFAIWNLSVPSPNHKFSFLLFYNCADPI